MLDCLICSETFDKERYIPKVIHCGHTICQICLKRILETSAVCPFDNSFFKDLSIENYPTDHAMLKASQQVTSSHNGSEIQKMSYLEEKRKKQSQTCERKKELALQLIENFQENMEKMHKEEFKTLSRIEDVQNWALQGLEITTKKLKVQACYREDLNTIYQELSHQPSQKLSFQIDDFLQSFTKELKILEENYKISLKNLVLNPSNLLRQKMETVSQLIQITKGEDFIGIMPKEFGTGCTDILREIEVWKETKKVVIFFKKDRINQEVLQAMAAVFEEFVNVTEIKLDLRNQSMTDDEFSLLFERQFWQKSSANGLTLDMENSKASSTALKTVLSKITTDMPHLTSLNIWMHGTQISDEGLEALGKHILAPLCYLQHLGLGVSECKRISDAGLNLLVPMMTKSLGNLKSLIFSIKDNPQLRRDSLAFISKNFLRSFTRLESFYLFLAEATPNDSCLENIFKSCLQPVKNLSLFLNNTKITSLGAQFSSIQFSQIYPKHNLSVFIFTK